MTSEKTCLELVRANVSCVQQLAMGVFREEQTQRLHAVVYAIKALGGGGLH